jgi:undecaprenyl-diphosphatase
MLNDIPVYRGNIRIHTMEKIIQVATRRCVAILLLLLCSAHAAYTQGSDIRWLRSIYNSSGSKAMEGISLSNYVAAVALPTGQLIYGYAANDSVSKRNALQTAAGLALTTGITYALKYSIRRERPFNTYPDIKPARLEDGYSIPSGHASLAFSMATSVSLQYRKWYIVAPAFLYAGLVSYSRLYLGVHYPSDVLVGAAVGAGSAWLCYKGQQWLLKKKCNKNR